MLFLKMFNNNNNHNHNHNNERRKSISYWQSMFIQLTDFWWSVRFGGCHASAIMNPLLLWPTPLPIPL